MNAERAARLVHILEQHGYHGLICRLPEHVMMLTGYLPVLGNSFCVVALTRDGRPECRLLVPDDERDLVPAGAAAEVQTYTEETLQRIGTTLDAVPQPLGNLLRAAGLREDAVVGYEGAPVPVATAYTQLGIPGPATLALYRQLLPRADWRDVSDVLDEVGAIKTDDDIERIRRAIAVAKAGFDAARSAAVAGSGEADVVAETLAALTRAGYRLSTTGRVLPHAHAMAGPRAALAYRAFNMTSNAKIERGDTVLVQIEIGIDGCWSELTRTFFVGDASDEWADAHEACVEAQNAALAVIRAGVRGREADAAARGIMESRGWGNAFKHGLGHGVGFQAINHSAAPILHPVSDAVLYSGMVHNLEPAVYLDGQGGLRLNDDVAVTRTGADLLSSAIPRDITWAITS